MATEAPESDSAHLRTRSTDEHINNSERREDGYDEEDETKRERLIER
jgi:hypothetical protein